MTSRPPNAGAPPPKSGSVPPPLRYVRRTADGLEIAVKVVPGASRPGIAGALGERLKVRVAEPAEGGRANAAVERLIAGWLGVRQARVVAGHSRPEKTVAVTGLTEIPEAARASGFGKKT